MLILWKLKEYTAIGSIFNIWSPDNINLRGNSNRWPYDISTTTQLGQPCGLYLIVKLKAIQFITPQT